MAWLDGVQSLVDAGRIVQELKTSSMDSGDFTVKRRKLFASREDILALANPPEHVKVNSAALDLFLGGQGSVLVVDDVDCAAAKRQFEEWFAHLQAATRHSTAMAHALQTKLAEGGKSLLGSDASTAAALTLQWSATDQALMEEERLLGDKTCLQVMRESVRCAVEAADELRAYLARSKDDWVQMDRLQPLLEHLGIFPDLASDDSFFQRLADVADLPIIDGVAGDEKGGPWEVTEIEEANVREFRLLCRKAHKLQGNTIPIFVVLHGKVYAKYSFDGLLSLKDFATRYEIHEDYLNTVFASISSAAAAFQHHVGQQHGNAQVENMFVDVVAGGRVTLGAHCSSADKADMPALTESLERFALAHGLAFEPHRPLFKTALKSTFAHRGASSPTSVQETDSTRSVRYASSISWIPS